MVDADEVYDVEMYNILKENPIFYHCHEYTIIKGLSPSKTYSQDCLSGMKILDLACGQGREIGHLLEKGAQEVIGLDISQEMVETAKKLLSHIEFPGRKFSVYRADCFSSQEVLSVLPLSEYQCYFDAISAFWLHCCAQNLERLSEGFLLCNKLLKLGGEMAFITANPRVATEYETFRELTSHDFFAILKNPGNSNGIPTSEIAFVDLQTREEKFVLIAYIYSLEQFSMVLGDNGFEMVESSGFEANPEFNLNGFSEQFRALICGEYSEGYYIKARKVINK
ncbi:unnamed protein product [Blepharisma stoltei]|uniref:Methyltransferase domain-containing protein n=1 Tax=Blepharisma stoltei TaxID=1481888 RepID=A0AAU9INT1_9CILI|nr:unnamed protein product [Blepharisma stoltei]